MKYRCDSEKCRSYRYYGGRGITYQTSWRDFDNFVLDMGVRPFGLTLERLDTNGDYCKSNCVWATRKEQARNWRHTMYVQYKGQRVKFSELLEEIGRTSDSHTLRSRVSSGWDIEEALSEPIHMKATKSPHVTERDGHKFMFRGEWVSLSELAAKYGIKYATLKTRVCKLKWPIELAVDTPARHLDSLTVEEIKSDLLAYRREFGAWPKTSCKRLRKIGQYVNISQSLYKGNRGLPGGCTLGSLISELEATNFTS